MKKIFLSLVVIINTVILVLLCTSCRDWVIEVEGYELHQIDDKYYIASIPAFEKRVTEYVIPTKIGDYDISGFGSTRSKYIMGGPEEIRLDSIKKLYIPKEIEFLFFESFNPILIETEVEFSKISLGNSFGYYQQHFFLAPKEDLELKYVDESNCYDGLIYDEKDDGFAKVIYNYSDNFILHEKFNGLVVNEIDYQAFMNSNIKTFNIPSNISIIKDYAFYESSLENLTFSDSVINIGDYAFSKCQIEELDFSHGEIHIGNYAFSNNKLKEVHIPNNVITLLSGVFSNNLIESFSFDNEYINHLPSSTFNSNPLNGTLNFGDKIVSIGDNALSYNSRTELIIPNQINSIGKINYCKNLKKLVLPNTENIVNISYNFLSNMDSLEELHLGSASSFTYIVDNIWFENLKVITVSEHNKYLYIKNGVLHNKLDDSILRFPAKLELEEYVINNKVNEGAFALCSYLKKVEINVKLESKLFWNCDSLEKVVLNSNIKEIPEYAFAYCDNLKEINLDNIVLVRNCAFQDCKSLQNINLSKCNVVYKEAFKNCDLRTVSFTRNIMEIQKYAFEGNGNLKVCNCYDATVDEYAFYRTPLHKLTEKEKEYNKQEWKYRIARWFPWILIFD